MENMERFAQRAPRDFDTVLRILETAAEFWSEEGIPFHVLLSGVRPASAPLPEVRSL
jgi:hypothetical protein